MSISSSRRCLSRGGSLLRHSTAAPNVSTAAFG
jgi:hypothetical protein